MIFKQWQQVLDGTKTQTRRLAKSRDYLGWHLFSDGLYLQTIFRWKTTYEERGIPEGYYYPLYSARRTYAVQPGRGKKAVGYICITGIRRERIQDIIDVDAMAEGIYEWYKQTQDFDMGWSYWLPVGNSGAAQQFPGLWNDIYKKPGTRWVDNPEVWVLEFEVVNEDTV